jgi:hypothetical protein
VKSIGETVQKVELTFGDFGDHVRGHGLMISKDRDGEKSFRRM